MNSQIPSYIVIEDERAAYAARYHGLVPNQRQLRRMIVLEYGGRCACCGVESEHLMTVDHIEPVLGGSRKTYLTLWREGFPKENLQHSASLATVLRPIIKSAST
jgi:hypothetical protein